MIVLAASDTLAAGGEVASMLTSTVFGMELASGVETYKVLDQRQLASSPATIYTVPGSTQTFIKTITVVNNDSQSRQAQFFRGGTGASNAVSHPLDIPAHGLGLYEDGRGWQLYTEDGEKFIQVLKSAAIDNYGISVPSSTAFFGDAIAENYQRRQMDETNTTLWTTGQLYMSLIYLFAGQVVYSISMHSATTALSGGTHQIFGIYDTSRTRLATTSDDGATAWAANTLKTLALTSPYTVPTTGLYYAAATVAVSTTMPTMKGMAAPSSSVLRGQAPICHGLTSDSGLTALPSTAGAITQGTTSAWFGFNGMNP